MFSQIALSMTEYLIREEEYIPWVAAINNFQVRNKFKNMQFSCYYVIGIFEKKKSSLQDKQELLGQFSSTVEQKLHHWEWRYNEDIFLPK